MLLLFGHPSNWCCRAKKQSKHTHRAGSLYRIAGLTTRTFIYVFILFPPEKKRGKQEGQIGLGCGATRSPTIGKMAYHTCAHIRYAIVFHNNWYLAVRKQRKIPRYSFPSFEVVQSQIQVPFFVIFPFSIMKEGSWDDKRQYTAGISILHAATRRGKKRKKILDAFNNNRCNPGCFFYLVGDQLL